MLTKKIMSLFAFAVVAVMFSFLMSAEDESLDSNVTALAQPLVDNLIVIEAFPEKSSSNTIQVPQPETMQVQAKPQTYLDSIKANPEKNSFHDALIKDRQQQNKYPEYNQRIVSIEQDPIERRYEIDERTTQNEEGDRQLTIWTNQKFYLHGDEVTVFAILEDARGIRLKTDFIGQLIYNETQDLQHFTFKDTDQDGVYEYRFRLDNESHAPLLAGVYKILIVNNTNQMVDAASFTLSQPEAILTGEYRDAISSKGNLIIEAEVDVAKQNRYYLQASLYSSTNDPIGTTQISSDLAPGRQWVALEFDGMMIRDVSEPGPYLLKSISFAKVAFPIQRAPLIYPEFYTQGYSADQFRNTNYTLADSHP
mgnify:FL=1